MAIVRLRGQLEKLAGGEPELAVEAGTVGELLQQLERDHSGLEGWILDERGVLRRHINVFVNGEPAEPETELEATDKVEILPAISGG
ncbi:MAG TPA: MoaD/ThiS family protein [Solirubrobacteraceae bacterium]|nr:MoaD/ThiS family protein [Solirubrobacteraceae bacterium]